MNWITKRLIINGVPKMVTITKRVPLETTKVDLKDQTQIKIKKIKKVQKTKTITKVAKLGVNLSKTLLIKPSKIRTRLIRTKVKRNKTLGPKNSLQMTTNPTHPSKTFLILVSKTNPKTNLITLRKNKMLGVRKMLKTRTETHSLRKRTNLNSIRTNQLTNGETKPNLKPLKRIKVKTKNQPGVQLKTTGTTISNKIATLDTRIQKRNSNILNYS